MCKTTRWWTGPVVGAARALTATGFLTGMGAALCAGGAPASASVVYVSAEAPPGGDGASWATAHRFLQDALAAAGPGSGVTEIRVAQGVYKPDRSEAAPNGTGDRHATFQLIDGVALLGGFAGPNAGKADPDERDWEMYETILSGDLLGNDGPGFANNGENSYTVVTGSDTGPGTVLEGFVIESGNANGPTAGGNHPVFRGGGMYTRAGTPSIRHCVFRMNYAFRGGAMQNHEGGAPLVEFCTFVNNSSGRGGATHNWIDAHAAYVGCNFISNTADDEAGAIFLLLSDVTIVDCNFESNHGGLKGGAIACANVNLTVSQSRFAWNTVSGPGGAIDTTSAATSFAGSCFTIVDCEFVGNDAFFGGAMYARSSCDSSTIRRCAFTGNSAWLGGGLLMSTMSPSHSVRMVDCIITENVATPYFAGGCLIHGDIEIVNTVVAGNYAPSIASGILYDGGFSLINSTVANNYGNGIARDPGATLGAVSIDNSIVWGNTGVQIDDSPLTVVNFSNIQGGWSGAGSNNMDADPLFVQPGTFNFRLSEGSPCIDAGDNRALPADIVTDLDGNPRIINGVVDLGPYEGEHEMLPPAAASTNIPPGTFAVLSPGGGDWTDSASIIFMNTSSETADYALVTQLDASQFEDAGGYSTIAPIFDFETSLADREFKAAILYPFDDGDLEGDAFEDVRVTRLDESDWSWGVAVEAAIGGPSPALPPIVQVGEQFTSLSTDVGKHGVFWQPSTQSGTAWATVDVTGIFSAGLALCRADFTKDGNVGVPDLLVFLSWWSQGNMAADLDKNGTIDANDLLLFLSEWGPCP